MIRWDSKELLDNTRHGLYEKYNITITDTEISNIVRAFFRIVRRLMGATSAGNKVDLFSGISLPGLGALRVNDSVKRRFVNRHIYKDKVKAGSLPEYYQAMEELYSYGWRYFKWVINKGYLFIHLDSGAVMAIPSEEAINSLVAIRMATKVIEEFCYSEGLMYRPNVEFVPFEWNPVKSIYKYSILGHFIRKYDNLLDVCIEHNILRVDLMEKLRSNEIDEGIRFTACVGEYVFVKGDGYVGPRVFNNSMQPIKYTMEVSMLDRFTGEVVYERIGTLYEAARFLRYLTKKNIEPYYIYKRGILENRVIYGYKWRREDTPENDKLQAERHNRESK